MSARTLGLLSIAAVLVAAVVWWAPWSTSPEPPTPPDLQQVDPDVAALVRETLDGVADDPADASAWARLGMVYEANGLIGAARDAYRQALGLQESEARWWYRLGLVQARLGDVAGAIVSVTLAIDRFGGYAPAHWHKGLWLFDQDDVDGAEAAFTRATEVDGDDAGGWVGLSRVFLVRQQPERAVEVLEDLLDRQPGDRYALQLLGRAYRQLGRVEEARLALAMASGGEPLLRDPWSEELVEFQRGYATLLKAATQYRVAGQLVEAITIYEDLRVQRPDDLALLNRLASAYLVAGRHDEGLALLTDAVGRDPDHVETQVNLASAYLRLDDPPRALEHAEHALVLSPRSGRAHEARGMILWQTDRRADAVAAFGDARRYDPRNHMALVWTGMVLDEMGRPRDALASFEAAVSQAPGLPEAWLGIAKIRMALGGLDDAELALRRAAQLDGQNPQVAAGLARLEELREAAGASPPTGGPRAVP